MDTRPSGKGLVLGGLLSPANRNEARTVVEPGELATRGPVSFPFDVGGVLDEATQVEAEGLKIGPGALGICVLGTPTLDEILVLDAYPRRGASAYAQEIHAVPGGGAANVSYVLARLGSSVTFIGPHGDDETGVMLLNTLTEVGVDTWSCYPLRGSTSKKVLIMLDPEGERTFLVHPGANLDDGHPVDLVRAIEHKIVYVDALRPDLLQSLRATPNPPVIVATIQEWWQQPLSLEIIEHTDYLIANDRVVVRYEHACKRALQDSGVPLKAYISVSNARGADLCGAAGATHVDVLSGPVVDNTGAEESFAAGILYSLARGAPLDAGMHLGALLQGHARTAVGCREPFADQEVLRILLRNSLAFYPELSLYFPELKRNR